MGPEVILGNIASLLQALMNPAGVVAAVLAVLAYGIGRAGDSPNTVRWGKGSAVGALVLFSGSAVISIIQNVSQRTFG